MSTDYAEKERNFIAGLAEDTGRDLAAWMTAISGSGFNDRNAIIDWLRHQGFQFANASWLERIHHNGGRLIYADDVEHTVPAARPASRAFPMSDEPPRRERPVILPRPPAPKPSPVGDDIQRLLAEAKGLRPLADLILREVARAVPDAEFTASTPLVVMSAPLPFAALLPGPKKLRLYGSFGSAGAADHAKPADTVNRAAATFPEMLVLDDARSIDENFQRLIRATARR